MGSFELIGTGGITGLVEITETVDRDANTSVLHCQLYLKSSRWYGVTYWLRGQALGRSFSSDEDSVYLPKMNTYFPVGDPWDMTVAHDPNGSGSVLLTVELRGYTVSGGQDSGWKLQGSQLLQLTDIPQASAVSVTDGNIGEAVQISILRRDPACTHKLQYFFGTLSGEIDPKNEINIPFVLPEEFYYEIPNSPTGLCRMVCTTYRNGQQVGTPTEAVFTVTATNCAPIMRCFIKDLNPDTVALTGDSSVLVRYLSHVVCAAMAEPQKGADLIEATVNGERVPCMFKDTACERYVFTVNDTRGYVTEVVMEPTVIPYFYPTVSGFCSRTDGDGNARLTVQGTWFGGLNNTIRAYARVEGRTYDLEVAAEGNSYKAGCILENLSYKRDYTIEVWAEDFAKTCTATVTLKAGKPLFDWSQKDFAFHVPVTAPMINGIKNPVLRSWPVGSVLLTADGVSPAATVGGRWEQFELSGLPVMAWKRVQGADTLGYSVLGEFILGRED